MYIFVDVQHNEYEAKNGFEIRWEKLVNGVNLRAVYVALLDANSEVKMCNF